MTETAVFEQSTEHAPTEGAVVSRPDVAVVVGPGDVHHGLPVAVAEARQSGGKLCVLRYLDHTDTREAKALIERSAEARSELATIVSRECAEFARGRIWSRLHIGSLRSLLTTLEPSIGAVVVEGPTCDSRTELQASCSVPVEVVD